MFFNRKGKSVFGGLVDIQLLERMNWYVCICWMVKESLSRVERFYFLSVTPITVPEREPDPPGQHSTSVVIYLGWERLLQSHVL
jgi:hypothetical protein